MSSEQSQKTIRLHDDAHWQVQFDRAPEHQWSASSLLVTHNGRSSAQLPFSPHPHQQHSIAFIQPINQQSNQPSPTMAPTLELSNRPLKGPMLRLFKRKEFFKSESDVVGGVLWLYSRIFSRLIFLVGLVYGFYMQSQIIICETSQNSLPKFIESVCILPNYGAHGLHAGPFRLPEGQKPTQLNFYIWIYALFLAQTLLALLPLLYLQHTQKLLITQLSEISELINAEPKVDKKKLLLGSTEIPKKNASKDDGKKDDDKKEVKKSDKKSGKKPCLKNVKKEQEKGNQKDPKKAKTRLETSLLSALKVNAFLYNKTAKDFIGDLVKAHLLAVGTVLLQISAYVLIFGPELVPNFFGYVRFLTGFADTLPDDRVFPFFGSCHYHNFAPTGSLSTVDSFCIMKLNLLNLYLVHGMLFLLLLCLVLLIVPLALQLIYIRSGAFRRQVLLWTHRVKAVFVLKGGSKNIDKIYQAEALATKIYYWPFAMLQFTAIDTEHLLQKVDDAKQTLEKATREKFWMELDKKTYNLWHDK